ncbi:carboxyl-terminal-processing peptidase 3, chloroplastic-like [Euphorbia lathyris]|uniref:carboxyl-terminal-processing peptidase 3, chloroplastic-like n=1 Tax=Euphorbia lathyris TaxID=212925 RepID=UPI003313B548
MASKVISVHLKLFYVAQVWLDGDETLVNTTDRDGNMLPINMQNGHAIAHDPLVVLILAGALHDNRHVILVGHKTFGKGKIQSVTELNDGSALFVMVAKYLSPALHDIDQVGITPDVQCTADMLLNSPKDSFLKNNNSDASLEAIPALWLQNMNWTFKSPEVPPSEISASLAPKSATTLQNGCSLIR